MEQSQDYPDFYNNTPWDQPTAQPPAAPPVDDPGSVDRESHTASHPQWAPAEGEISVGMDASEVRTAWGEPGEVDTAGDPSYGNQKWTYFEGLSSPFALRSGKRVVYFERNRVVGWNINR